MPLISVLVNCFNGERYLQTALNSIYAQTFQDWEIIFIDNASTDSSAKIAQSYDKRLKYYRTNQTLPLYAARQFAMQYITGDYLAFVDADDEWLPNKLEMQLNIMKHHPHVYLVCTGYYSKKEISGQITRKVNFRSKILTFNNTLSRYPINLSTVMLRVDKSSKDKIFFEPTINLTGDYELFMRIIYLYKGYYLAHPLVISRIHSNNLSSQLMKEWPKEIAGTHLRWEKELHLSDHDKRSAEKRLLRACSYIHLSNGDNKTTREITKKYLFKDVRLSIIYFSSFSKALTKYLLMIRGFSTNSQ